MVVVNSNCSQPFPTSIIPSWGRTKNQKISALPPSPKLPPLTRAFREGHWPMPSAICFVSHVIIVRLPFFAKGAFNNYVDRILQFFDTPPCALNRVLRGHFLGVKMLQCNIKSLAGPIVVEQLLESWARVPVEPVARYTHFARATAPLLYSL